MHLPDIVTPRLVLEPLEARHAPEMFDGLQDVAGYVHISGDAPPTSIEALAARYTDLETRVRKEGTRHWLNWAVRRQADGACLGYVQATVMLDDQRILLAAHMFPEHWRKGIGKESVTAMIAWLCETYPCARYEASIAVQNTASRALVEALGFEQVRHSDESGHVTYAWQPAAGV